ncbi:protein NUCLEAR FUSION DEFECTIVE 4-like [Bidens hawaiensis]|uniref:protein NUCLEAR FUSION DEFECTIVE 4-like n=1 Tax=Bidens hawaiensis TaxID=980011 RepID=UPI004049C16F
MASGNAYSFPLYSHSLKSVLGLSQQLTVLGVANDFGENDGILPGIASNKYPSWVVLLIGVAASFFGYGVIWLAVSETVLSMPYWILWLSLVVATNSSAWVTTAVLGTNMRNFPLSRGTVAGILKGYVGLSAAVITEVYTMVLNGSASALLLFFALGIPIVCLGLMCYIRPCTPASEPDPSETTHFLFTQGASIVLAVFLLTTTILNGTMTLSSALSYTFIVIMVVLLMALLAIPVKMTLFPSNKKHNLNGPAGPLDDLTVTDLLLTRSTQEPNLSDGDDISDVDVLLAVGEGAVKIKKKRPPRRGEDFTFREAVVKADFWLLWLVYFLGVRSGVTVLNNLAQIGVSLGFNDTTTLLSLFSFCNFLGRLGGGVISECFVRLKTLPQTFLTMVTQIIMVMTYPLYASAINGTLYVATALLGICYGVQFGVMIPTSSELFGLKIFGLIFNFMGLGNPIGALLFSGMLVGYVYDAEEAKQGGSTCMGPNCFRLAFFVLAGVCCLSAFLSLILTIRIWPVYQML